MIDSYENNYQQILKEFSSNLQRFISMTLSRNKVPIIITMSRKMARIMEWLKVSGFISIPKNAIVISEYALCFCMDELKNRYNGNVEVLITDDIVNTGESVEHLALCVWAYTNHLSYVLPIIIRDGYDSFKYCELLGKGITYSNDIVDYCVIRNTENLMSLGIPLDMEFPIVEVNIQKDKVKAVNIEDALKESFPMCSVYHTTHAKINSNTDISTNYSVLFDENKTNEYVSCDFSKMRIFVGDKKLKIEAYSPRTIDENVIMREQVFRDNNLQTLWNLIKKGIVREINSCNSNNITAFIENKVLSEIVMLNYLYSFAFLKSKITNIQTFLNKINVNTHCKIDVGSLALLVSLAKAEEIAEELNSILYQDTIIELEYDNLLFSFDDNEVSEDIKEVYETNNTIQLLQSSTVEEGMASIFHNQSKLLLKYEKAYESFTSLNNKLSLHVKAESMMEKIHRCMDFMIDDASITPLYVAKEKDGLTYWKRMFKAGDNSILLDKISSVISYILGTYMSVSYQTVVEKDEFATVLSMVLSNDIVKLDLPYVDKKISIKNASTYSCPVFSNVDTVDLLRYANNHGYFETVIIDEVECLKSIPNEVVSVDTFLNDNQKQYIHDILYFICMYSKHEVMYLRYVMLNIQGDFYNSFANTYKQYLLNKLEHYKEDNLDFRKVKNELYKSISLVIDIQNANYLLLKKDLSPLVNDEKESIKNIWLSVYSRCPDDYDVEYLEVSNKMDIVILLLMSLIDRFILNNPQDAIDTCQKISSMVDIESFEDLIKSDVDYKNSNSLVADILIQTVNKIFE